MISARGSETVMSIRSNAATTALSGIPRAGGTIDSRTYPRRRAAASSRSSRRLPSARWLPLGACSRRSSSWRSVPARGCQIGASLPARRRRSLSSRPIGTSIWSRSAPASTAWRASCSAPPRSGSPIAAPIHGRLGSPSTAISSVRAVRLASIRSIAAPTRRRASSSAIARRSGSRRRAASKPRSTAPDATSRASRWGSRSYSARAIANGRTIPDPSRPGPPPR